MALLLAWPIVLGCGVIASLVGTDMEKICTQTQRLLDDSKAYQSMSRAQNPYGDGTTSVKIADILNESLAAKIDSI